MKKVVHKERRGLLAHVTYCNLQYGVYWKDGGVVMRDLEVTRYWKSTTCKKCLQQRS